MTRNSKHLKRYAAPRTWVIPRKKKVWAVRSSPGPHKADSSMPLLIALRDIAGLGETSAEVRKILGNREVMVDGKVRVNYKHPVGLMDIISIPKIDRYMNSIATSIPYSGAPRIILMTHGPRMAWTMTIGNHAAMLRNAQRRPDAGRLKVFLTAVFVSQNAGPPRIK